MFAKRRMMMPKILMPRMMRLTCLICIWCLCSTSVFSAALTTKSDVPEEDTTVIEPKTHTPSPSFNLYPAGQQLYDQYRWSAMYYYGVTVSDALIRMVYGEIDRWPEHIQSIELSRTLSQENFLRRLVNPLVGVVQLSGNFTVREGSREHTIYEFNPYLTFRWANLPWNHYVNTSLAIGEGISYDTSVPSLEKKANKDTKRLLNYLMLEATFAAPSYPRLQLVARIHHRSGAFGLYRAGNTGSNVIGLGLRYLFD